MFTVSDAAKQEILNHLNDENRYLRIFVQGGGCSGFKYGFNLEECVSDDDIQIPLNQFSILVDTFSSQYLQNASIDFEEDLSGKKFTIKNSNAQTTCGCGSSFSV